ncbi:hypothetical protein [Paenibacillus ginsengarvi]|uniref:Uncharacterized protein n=1 Tax=Paenibacillus ginsengarvi TaxID=400777 RepID=A0A3B0CNL3_9BACL|nr:hypothetical protein [Paenibacillus ginsengarvi]RKN86722.1 hypothetical protein D7M11_01835 [Paenibacillus ginsengarvi]
MYKFDAGRMFEGRLQPYSPVVERRDPFIDIYMKLTIAGVELPDDLNEPGALVICRNNGEPIDYVVLDEGCDCEYRFTELEKDQLRTYIAAERLHSKAKG